MILMNSALNKFASKSPFLSSGFANTTLTKRTKSSIAFSVSRASLPNIIAIRLVRELVNSAIHDNDYETHPPNPVPDIISKKSQGFGR